MPTQQPVAGPQERPWASRDLCSDWIYRLRLEFRISFEEIAVTMSDEFKDSGTCAAAFRGGKAIYDQQSSHWRYQRRAWTAAELEALEKCCLRGCDWDSVRSRLCSTSFPFRPQIEYSVQWHSFQKPKMEARLRQEPTLMPPQAEKPSRGPAPPPKTTKRQESTSAFKTDVNPEIPNRAPKNTEVPNLQPAEPRPEKAALLSQSQVELILQLANDQEQKEKELQQRELDADKKKENAKATMTAAEKVQAEANENMKSAQTLEKNAKDLMAKAQKLETKIRKQQTEMDAAKGENDRKRRIQEDEGNRLVDILMAKRPKIEGATKGTKLESGAQSES